jgi:hypothetical protein
MTHPKEGDIVAVTLSGEVYESCDPTQHPGYIWIRVPGLGNLQVNVDWVRVIKEKQNGTNGSA